MKKIQFVVIITIISHQVMAQDVTNYKGRAFLEYVADFDGKMHPQINEQNPNCSSYFFIGNDGFLNYIDQGFEDFRTTLVIDSSYNPVTNEKKRFAREKLMLHEITYKAKFFLDKKNSEIKVKYNNEGKTFLLFKLIKKDTITGINNVWYQNDQIAVYNYYEGKDTVIHIKNKIFNCWICSTLWDDSGTDVWGKHQERFFIDKESLIPVRVEYYFFKTEWFKDLVPEKSHIRYIGKIIPMNYKNLEKNYK